jgi:Flp pilus assembly protein TadG
MNTMRTRLSCLEGDRGSMSLLFAICAIGLIAIIGLVYDGGRAQADRSEAYAVAAEAARAGAGALDLEYLRATGVVRLDPAQAQAAAAAWISASGLTGTATATTGEVTVNVTADTSTELLGVVGIDVITVHGEATARPRTGITAPFGGT